MYDALWEKGPRFYSEEGVFKLGSDAVLLADFAGGGRAKKVCDLGCGGGVLSVLLALDAPEMHISALDLSEAATHLTARNAALNGVAERIETVCGDLREVRTLLPSGVYDLVVSNPPYFSAGSGIPTPDEMLMPARGEVCCTLDEVCAAARYLLRWGGRFCLVFRPERLAELFHTMYGHNLTPKKLRMVQLRGDSAPSLVLVEGRHGGGQGLQILPPLLLEDDAGRDSAEVRRIYRRER